VDTNLPSNPPYGVNWKRPYLDWKPDESWLAMMLAPPAVEEPEIVQPEPAAASAEPEGVAAAPSAPAAPPGGMFEDAPPGDMMGGAPPQ